MCEPTPRRSTPASGPKLGNLATEALNRLGDVGISKRQLLDIEQELSDLTEDDEFWRHQAGAWL